MSPADIAELERLLAEATPGPWVVKREEGCVSDYVLCMYGAPNTSGRRELLMSDEQYYPTAPSEEADWELIVAIVNVAPELIAAVKELERLRKQHERQDSVIEEYQYQLAAEHEARNIAEKELEQIKNNDSRWCSNSGEHARLG